MTMNIFEKATKTKLRFEVRGGVLSTEDLWNLPLEHSSKISLDGMYKDLHSKVKDSEEVSLINTPKRTKAEETTQLRFDIVTHIIKSRLADKERSEKAAETRAHNQRIDELIARKKDEELAGKSIEELEAMRAG